MEIVRSRSPKFHNANNLAFYNNSSFMGELDYKPANWIFPTALLWITTTSHGKGYSKEFLQAFINEVHSGMVKMESVTHAESWNWIRNTDLLEQVYNGNNVSITASDKLKEVPIVHVLQSGGIKIKKMVLRRKFKIKEEFDEVIRKITNGEKEYTYYFRCGLEGNINKGRQI
ncbi:MAG: hypothetical protein Q7R95_06685 [bacterium]|nr:hypothetical protein [bacterium]